MSEALVKASDLARMPFDELVNQDSQSLALALQQARRQYVSTLGNGEVFVRKDDQGMVRAVRGVMRLSEAQGELYSISQGKGKDGNWKPRKYMISAPGYYKCNQIAGLSIRTPQTVTLPDGSKVINPYLVRERDRNGIPHTVGVWVRKVVIGHSPIGNLCVVDASLYLDLHLYFMQDLLKKITAYPENGSLAMEATITPEMRKTHLVLPYQYGICIVGDITKKGVRGVIDTHINRQKNAERVAVTITERNGLKKHPGIAVTQVLVNNGVAQVQVFGWKHDLTERDMDQIVQGMEEGEATPGVEIISHSATLGDDEGDIIDAEASVDANRDKEREIQRGYDGDDEGEPPEQDGEEEKLESLFAGKTLSVKEALELLKSTYKEKFEAAYDDVVSKAPVDWKQMSPSDKMRTLKGVGDLLQKRSK